MNICDRRIDTENYRFPGGVNSGCLARVSIFCTTFGIRILTLVTKQMASHERGHNDGIITTTNGTYMWSSVTPIFRNAKPNDDGDRKAFK